MRNKLKTLYLVSPTLDFSKIFPGAILLTSFKENLPEGVYYTSVLDLPSEKIIKLSLQFDEIKLESTELSENKEIFNFTKEIYDFITAHCKRSNQHTIQQFTDHKEIEFRQNLPVLWVFGCSHSHGIGLRTNEASYGQLVSEKLNLPLKLITKPGSSLHWSHRHLLNAPIESRDIVIWQLTSYARLSIFNGSQVVEVMMGHNKNKAIIEFMTDEQMSFTHFNLINTGYRFLKSVGCKFIFTSTLRRSEVNNPYFYEYIKYPEYMGNWNFVDVGTDGKHGGPLTHFTIAQQLLDKLQYKNV